MHTGKIEKSSSSTIHSRVCVEHASPKPAMQVQCAQMILPFHSAAIKGLVSGWVWPRETIQGWKEVAVSVCDLVGVMIPHLD